jgi:hypothetical protein
VERKRSAQEEGESTGLLGLRQPRCAMIATNDQ